MWVAHENSIPDKYKPRNAVWTPFIISCVHSWWQSTRWGPDHSSHPGQYLVLHSSLAFSDTSHESLVLFSTLGILCGSGDHGRPCLCFWRLHLWALCNRGLAQQNQHLPHDQSSTAKQDLGCQYGNGSDDSVSRWKKHLPEVAPTCLCTPARQCLSLGCSQTRTVLSHISIVSLW